MIDVKRTAQLTRRGFMLEGITLAWNVVGVVVLAVTALAANSIALAAFGLDSLIEIGASTVVIWELSGSSLRRQRIGLRLLGYAFLALCIYLLVQSMWVVVHHTHSHPSPLGLGWTAMTAIVMFALGGGKALVGDELANVVIEKEAKVTLVDAILAATVTVGLVFAHNPRFTSLQAIPFEALVALVLCGYAGYEGVASIRAAKRM